MHHWLGMVAIGLSLTGCVSQEKYNAQKMRGDSLAEQLSQADAAARSARAEADAYRAQFGDISGHLTGQSALIQNLNAQNADLQRQYDEAMRKLEGALSRTGGTALPENLSNELSAFAAQNPDLVEFDASRGIVKFKSDVTFDLGDASVKPKAKEVIARFSQILNAPAAKNYELMVAGHTDNVRVSNPATKAKHPDNWYLSSHRAISVAQELMSQNVGPNRLAVVGYGEQRPAAPNTSDAGRAQNRRVEVLILPTTVTTAAVKPTQGGNAPRQAAPALNKESVNTDRGPVINK